MIVVRILSHCGYCAHYCFYFKWFISVMIIIMNIVVIMVKMVIMAKMVIIVKMVIMVILVIIQPFKDG
jgi:hypothetical protein